MKTNPTLCERDDGYVLWYWVSGEDDQAEFVHIPDTPVMVTPMALHHVQFQAIMAVAR